MKKTVVIIGGGAAGLTCAVRLKQLLSEYNVIVLEKNDRIAKKILKTGNGRCNISNSDMNENYYNHPDFVKKALQKVSTDDVILMFKSMGLLIKTDETSTRLYPYSESANSVVEIFRQEIERFNIDLRCSCEVLKIEKKQKFIIETNSGIINADIVVMASGSIAQEKTKGLQILEALGHKSTDLNPALVPLKTKENLRSLQGIRIKCLASLYNNGKIAHQEEGEILFKDEGLSGILSLNLSRFVGNNTKVVLDLFPNRPTINEELAFIMKNKDMSSALMGILPKMLAMEVTKRSLENNTDIVSTMKNLTFNIVGTYGYDQAQITKGGISIEEINDDFSSKKIKDLYIIGEILDIDGASGGYNLHFAWVSAMICASNILL